jgi:hypothetical protein
VEHEHEDAMTSARRLSKGAIRATPARARTAAALVAELDGLPPAQGHLRVDRYHEQRREVPRVREEQPREVAGARVLPQHFREPQLDVRKLPHRRERERVDRRPLVRREEDRGSFAITCRHAR